MVVKEDLLLQVQVQVRQVDQAGAEQDPVQVVELEINLLLQILQHLLKDLMVELTLDLYPVYKWEAAAEAAAVEMVEMVDQAMVDQVETAALLVDNLEMAQAVVQEMHLQIVEVELEEEELTQMEELLVMEDLEQL